MMLDNDLEDRRSAGKVLEIRSPFQPKEPTPIDHYVAPEVAPTDRQLADRQLARSIADQMLATVPDELRQAAFNAYQASAAAARALNAAQRELAALEAPAPAGLSVEQLGQRRIRKLGMADHLEDIRRQCAAADQACSVALDAARWTAEYGSGRALYTDQVRQIREMREEARRLLEQADRHQIALGNATGAIHSWLPTNPPAPVQSAPAQPAAVPARRKLFG